MTFPAFIDLHTLYEELYREPHYQKAKKWLKAAILRNACVADLKQAGDCLESLAQLKASPRKSGTMERTVTEAALLNHAITLYARATATKGKRGERGSRSISHELTDSQKDDHDALVDVRNRAIAHVYQGEQIDRTIWQQTVPLLIEFPPSFQPLFATQTIQFNKIAFERLARQLPVAAALMRGHFQDSINQFMESLHSTPLRDALIRKHATDPVAIFGTTTRVQEILDSARIGEATFID